MKASQRLSSALALLIATVPVWAAAQGDPEGEGADAAGSASASASAAPAPPPPSDEDAEAAAAEAELAAEEARQRAAMAKAPEKGRGAITGRVTDTKFNEPLIEAQVLVVGTRYSTLTDLDGNFRLDLPPGRYTLRVLYELHQAARLANVTVTSGEVTPLDVQLVPDERAAQNDVIDVQMEVAAASQEATQLERRRSANVGDAVGRAEISRSTDRNAAEATQRVPGASVVGGRFVYVRGLGERYTNAQLNGAPLPSPEPDRQTVPLDLFPALVVDNINVVKTFTPDAPADFAGGSVRISTRELPRETLAQLSLGAGFNTESSLRRSLTARGSSTDWLGYDGGTRAFPSGMPDYQLGTGQRPDGTTIPPEEEARQGRAINSYMSAIRHTTLPNLSGSLVLGDSFRVGKEGKLGVLSAVNYGRSFVRRGDYHLRKFGPSIGAGSGPAFGKLEEFEGQVDVDQVRWGAFLSTAYSPTRDHTLSLGYFHSQAADLEVRDLEGEDLGADLRYHYTRLGYVSRGLDFIQARGDHTFEALGRGNLTWNATTSRASRAEPDARETRYNAIDGYGYAFSNGAASGSHFWSDQVERGYAGGIDWTQPLSQDEHTTKIKVGGLASTRDREFSARRFNFEANRRATRDQIGCPGAWDPSCPDRLFTNDNIGGDNTALLRLRESTRPSDEYTAGLRVYAAYAMADAALARDLRLIFGERIEVTRQFIRATDQNGAPISQEIKSTDGMPAAALVLAASSRSNLRVAWSRTIARPQVREIAPFGFTSSAGLYEVQGNPGLSLTRITNADLRFEHFPSSQDVLAFSFFFKRFDQPIEEVIKPASNGTVISYANAEAANLIGAEAEARHGLGFVNPALKDFSLFANVTLARSRVELSSESARVATNPSRPLSFQSPFIVNAALDWSNADLGLRARLLYNVFGRRISTVGTNGLPDVYEQPRHQLDLAVAKAFGKQFEMKLTATNLLSEPVRFTQGKTRESDDSNVVESYNVGQTYTLTGTLTF